MFVSPVTEDEIAKDIRNLQSKKSPGFDEISPYVVKHVSAIIVKPLTHIFNCSFNEAVVPHQFKLAKIIPVHKKGALSLPGNYRPISL